MTCLHRFDEFKVRIARNSAIFSYLSAFFEFCFDLISNDFPETFHIKQVPGLSAVKHAGPKGKSAGTEVHHHILGVS